MEDDSSGEELSDAAILEKCEQQLNEMGQDIMESRKSAEREIRVAEKRKEREDDISEDDFITVSRRRPKRLIRSDSSEVRNGKGIEKENNSISDITNNTEVCVTSKDILPKPIAMAKLLRSENMKDVLRIKYKSPYKVLIQFQRKEDALKLIECQTFKEKGLRSQLLQDLSISYGIVKGVDLELSETELMSILESKEEIMSVRRLKRMESEGKWVDCESVRIAFKSGVLPEYVYVYGCRFAVEAYVFPVTQCSGCWQFGHVLKFCPSKKILCPKCGGNHENCSIKDFKCLNCKGNHFVLDKRCPLFLKEKTIRSIMSAEQVTYRKALQIYNEKKEKEIQDKNETIQNFDSTGSIIITNNDKETYSNVLTRAIIHEDLPSNDDEEERAAITEENLSTKQKTKKKINKTSHKSRDEPLQLPMDVDTNKSQKEEESGKPRNAQLLYKFEWRKIWQKIKEIYKSESKLEEKLLAVLKVIGEEVKNFFAYLILGNKIMGYVNHFRNG